VAFLCFGRPLMQVFTDEPEVVRLGVLLLAIAAFYQFFDALYITYAHALRGAGDTLVPALFTGGLCWLVMIGGGFLMAYQFPNLGVFGPWLAAMPYGITLGLWMFTRFTHGRWKHLGVLATHRSSHPAPPG
jgi:MATE family multidrug resistance protein